MFKVNNKDTRTTTGVVNFEHVNADWDSCLQWDSNSQPLSL